MIRIGKRVVVAGAVAVSVACGPGGMEPGEVAGATPSAKGASQLETPPKTVAAASAAAEAAPAPASKTPVEPPAAALPPPKPVSIPLARTGDAKLDALLGPGDRAFEEGDHAKAAVAYEAARKAFPRKAAPLVGLGRARVAKASPTFDYASGAKNAEVAAGVRDLKRAVEIDPGHGPAHVELGRALLLAGDAVQAEASLRKGARLLADEPEAHSALGVALLATGKAEEAAAELTRARELDPGSAARRGNLGTVLFMRGNVADAVKEYEVQVRLSPDDARAHSDLGTALLAQSDFARAIPELRRAIALDPKRATFRSNLGYALQLSGKPTDGITEYREALKLDPKLSSAWINLATALARDPKTRAEARKALETAQKLDPSDPRVKANLEELDALEKSSP